MEQDEICAICDIDWVVFRQWSSYPCAWSHFGICEILLLKYYSGHKDIETVKIQKNSSVEHEILF